MRYYEGELLDLDSPNIVDERTEHAAVLKPEASASGTDL
jgi:hypothetical protein